MDSHSTLLFGGTFNPIHFGHLLLATYAQEQMPDCDEVVFIPSGDHPHKKDILPFKDRHWMTVLATNERKSFTVSVVEDELDGPSYTINTIRHLAQTRPDNKLYWLIGPDNLKDLRNWYKIDELVEECNFVLAIHENERIWYHPHRHPKNMWYRSPDFVDHPFYEKMAQNMVIVGIPNIEIRSTTIRERVKQEKPITFMTTASVRTNILINGFYKDK